MSRPIKIFGDKAKEIKEGDIFIASVGSVEGHCVVTLISKNEHQFKKIVAELDKEFEEEFTKHGS